MKHPVRRRIMNGAIDDATIAAVTYIVDHLAGLPADRGAVEWFFWTVLAAYAAVVAEEERKRLTEPSQN
jgi:hypothetical protein